MGRKLNSNKKTGGEYTPPEGPLFSLRRSWLLYFGLAWLVAFSGADGEGIAMLGALIGPLSIIIWAIKSIRDAIIKARSKKASVSAKVKAPRIPARETAARRTVHDEAAQQSYNSLVEAYASISNFRRLMDAGDLDGVKACLSSCDAFLSCLDGISLTPSFYDFFISRAKGYFHAVELPDFEDFRVDGEDEQLADPEFVLSRLRKTTALRRNLLAEFCTNAEQFTEIINALPAADIAVEEKPAPKKPVKESYEVPFSNITKKTPRDKLGNFVAIDTETTGLNASQNEIVEIAAVRFRDFKPVEKFATLCAPQKGISEEASRINGITAEMVEGKPCFGQVVHSLQTFIGADNIVGHNLEFDLKFIVRGGFDVYANNQKYYDTLGIAKNTLKRSKDKWDKEVQGYITDYDKDFDVMNYKLKTLCDYYGITYLGAHRALADAYVTGLLLQALAKDRE